MRNNKSGKGLSIAMIAAVVVVLALGVAALVPKLAENIKLNRMASGDMNAIKVADQADLSGMEVEDFLSFYGVDDDGITGNSSIAELREQLDFGKYTEFWYGVEITEEDFAAFKTAKELGDDVTLESKDTDVKDAYDMYYAEQQAAAEAEAAAAEEAAAVTEGEIETEGEVVAEEAAE